MSKENSEPLGAVLNLTLAPLGHSLTTTEAMVYQLPSASQVHWVHAVISPILQMRKLRLQGVKALAQGHEQSQKRAVLKAQTLASFPAHHLECPRCCGISEPKLQTHVPLLHQVQLRVHRTSPHTACLYHQPGSWAAENSAAAASMMALCPFSPQTALSPFKSGERALCSLDKASETSQIG